MGLINNLMDKFKNAEFTVAPNKKLKTISADFKKAFELTLVFYKGAQIADGDLTLAALNKKTTKDVNAKADGLNGCRSSICSPTPINLTGIPSSFFIDITIPPFAVPSSLVTANAVMSVARMNSLACWNAF